MSSQKRPIIFVTSLALCCSALFTACSSSEKNTSQSSSGSTESSVSSSNISGNLNTAGELDPGEPLDVSRLPRMDGSTSAVPLETGLKSGFLGIPYSEAKELVSHTTTHDSFKRLIADEVDLILSVSISAEQQSAADNAGVTLTMEPVAREGFVFVVNASNPVSSLTQEQLRKIYSGEITNWKQVGGSDEPILPYQRNTDSGSQNYMTVFMGNTKLIKPKVDLIAVGMGGLMDAVAVYDNSAGAIGYSVYSYAAQMYANANKVKFIAVDGIEPSKATMADESYPLMSCTYAIYTDKSADSARMFTQRILSDQGQMFVLESGYLPVNGMDVPAKYLPYEAKGTGKPKPEGLARPEKYSYLTITPSVYQYDTYGIDFRGEYYELNFLNDKEFQAEINSDIKAAMDRLKNYTPPKKDEYEDASIGGIILSAEICNGYMSLIIGYRDPDHAYGFGSPDAYYQAETLCYDLVSGKKLEKFSDLFYKDEEFLTGVNNGLNESICQQFALFFPKECKIDFSGILGEPRLFTLSGILFEPDNLYFTCAPLIEFPRELTVTAEYRDTKEFLAEEYRGHIQDHSYYYPEWITEYVRENGDVYERYVGSETHTEAEVKAEDELWYGLQKRAWETIRKFAPNFHCTGETRNRKKGNYYSVGKFTVSADDDVRVNFDADTLEIITMEKLLGSGWEKYLTEENKALADEDPIPCTWNANYDGSGDILIFVLSTKNEFMLTMMNVPASAVNKRYAGE